MEKEEQYIYDRYGKQNPFTVPDGYFDSLRTGLMQHATTTTKAIPLWKRWRGYVAAACLVGVVTVGLATYWGLKRQTLPIHMWLLPNMLRSMMTSLMMNMPIIQCSIMTIYTRF